MATQNYIPFETARLLGNKVLLRRVVPGAESIQDLGVDPVFKSSVNTITAHAEAEQLASGLLVATAGTRKDRATVVTCGPQCRKVKPGQSVLLPAPNDIQKRFAMMDTEQDGTNWLVYREDDLITTFEVLPVPQELVGNFRH